MGSVVIVVVVICVDKRQRRNWGRREVSDLFKGSVNSSKQFADIQAQEGVMRRVVVPVAFCYLGVVGFGVVWHLGVLVCLGVGVGVQQ